ncbi:MAG: hypothetical protein SOZ78_04630 [Eubacteriales bacterium]|nr:hypothetical protein [Eubacteriales bacterium]
MSDVIKDLENAGYSLALLTPTAESCYIAWDADTDRVVYMDSEFKILYPKENKGETLANAWQIAHNKEQLDKYAASGKPFNVYLASGFDAIELVVSYGIDVGDNTGITKLSYVNTSGSAKNVVIRTNGGTLEVNAPLDTVHHYNSVDNVVITAVASESYHENGVVLGNISIAQGRVEVAESAKVGTVLVTGNGVKIDINNKETKVLVADDVTEQPNVSGAEISKAVTVTSYDELVAALETSGTIILGKNIKATRQLKVNGGVDITLNLNGYEIEGYTGVASFGIKGNLTIEGQGRIYSKSKVRALFYVFKVDGARGELTINGGNYELLNTESGSAALIEVGSDGYLNKNPNPDDYMGGIVTINGGNFHAGEICVYSYAKGDITINGVTFTSDNNAVIGTSGNAELGGNTITINGGTFNGNIKEEEYIACGIYLANNDTLVVNGGTFNITNGVGILVRSGKATIGKDVVINTNNKQLTTASSKVGDSNVKINVSLEIVIDKKSDYPGGDPVIEKNESKYDVFDNSK